MRIWGKHRIITFQIIALGFALMILAGTLLLMLPISSREGSGVNFSDCLFTATSAVCVTGLVVRDTVTCWSTFGQAVILFLIQIGGMGFLVWNDVKEHRFRLKQYRLQSKIAPDASMLIQTHVGIGYRMIRITDNKKAFSRT